MIKELINDIKMGFALTKYGLKLKLQLGMAAVFFILGIVIDVNSKGSTYLGGFYIVLAGMFIFQCIISMDASTLIQSSGYKKKMQIRYPYAAVIPLVVGFYTIIVIVHGIMAQNPMDGLTAAQNYDRQVTYLFAMNLLLFATLLYFGLCYKYFIVGMLMLFAVVFPLTIFISNFQEWIVNTFTLTSAIIMGYVLMAVGFAVSILLANVFYRKPLSRLAVRVNR